jgi:predicted Fe-Mo cluster-binding NifX family protein
MKIAATSNSRSLDDVIEPRFGRCRYYLIVETDTLDFEAIENPSISLVGGAGIQSAQLMADKGVTNVLTGNCGPNAYQTLNAAGINIIVGCSGIIREVIQQFKEGNLTGATQPNAQAHAGVGVSSGRQQYSNPTFSQGLGRGMGQGMGLGRGMGRGMGKGMGGGTGQGIGFNQENYPGPQVSNQRGTGATTDEELNMLKQQTVMLNQQIQQIQDQIRELEKKKNRRIRQA